MAGLYVHIPFCKTRCGYCDFFSTTLLDQRSRYVEALLEELIERQDYIPNRQIGTIYFGGGTPSLLGADQLRTILRRIRGLFEVADDAEITLEANPSDLSAPYLEELRKMGFNRLSVGVQSFDDSMLRLMGRRHDSKTALQALQWIRQAGFKNVSLDLIYALPFQTMEMWRHDLETALACEVEHMSTYCLTYEGNTPFRQRLQKGEWQECDEETENRFYETADAVLTGNGYEHYEVSSFCRPNFYSRHNSSYWSLVPYLGIGAGAHSYNGHSRQWNGANLEAYMRGVESGQLNSEQEVLTPENRYDELVMLSLRTQKGLDLSLLDEAQKRYCLQQARPFLTGRDPVLTLQNEHLKASLKGSEILNYLIEKLML